MKPKTPVQAKLIGKDGNIFNLVGIAYAELKKAGYSAEAQELGTKFWKCQSYDEALKLIREYVEVV
jgi:hypothetical protein